jgi:cell division protein FtsW
VAKKGQKAEQKGSTSQIDGILLAAVLIMMAVGLVMVMSASGVAAEQRFGDALHFFKKQALFTGLGLLVIYLCWRIPRSFFYTGVYVWLAMSLAAIGLTLSPLGVTVGGASRWLDLGPFHFQPLEAAKVALVLYLAYFFSHKQDKVKTFSVGFLPPLVVTTAMAGLLVLQPDFGGAIIMALLFFLLCLVGGTRLSYLMSSMLLCAAVASIMILQSPYRLKRWLAFLKPFQNAQDAGYQVVQSLYGLGAGHITGVGLGAGKQKLFFLPEAHTDFILAVLGEETGFLGVSLVFFCLGLMLFRCFAIAGRQQDLQDRFTALGLTLILGVGALLNAAVVLGTVPPKGLPMPFLSYGGSNLIIMCFCVGLILNIGDRRRT